jgi:hypothetical protein
MEEDFDRARRNVNAYLAQNANDVGAKALLASLPQRPVLAGLAPKAAERDPHKKHRPICPGISIGPASMEFSTAGTLCCIVKKKSDPHKRYILGAESIMGRTAGTPILQPGPLDGGSMPQDQVAIVSEVRPQDLIKEENRAWGVLAEIPDGVGVSSECLELGKFNGSRRVKLRDPVRKMGRTTGLTSGTVVAMDVALQLQLEVGTVLFKGLVQCKGDKGQSFSAGGDSGAPVVDASNRLVGMVIAGSDEVTYFIPIDELFSAFGVSLWTEPSDIQTPVKGAR